MRIKPLETIAENYDQISQLCKRTEEPVYLTRDGEVELVTMDPESFARRESMLNLWENLLAVEENRLNGNKGYTIEEAVAMMRAAIEEEIGARKG